MLPPPVQSHVPTLVEGVKAAVIDPLLQEARELHTSGAVHAAHEAERSADLADEQSLRTHSAGALQRK